MSQARSHFSQCMWLYALLLVLVVEPARLESQNTNSAGLISIRLEQKNGDSTKTVQQNKVFHNGDILRFRLTSRIAGYLYVVDKGSSGQTTTLFPIAAGAGAQNRIEPDQNIVVPAIGDGWFEVSGPSGFDTIYILVSATPILIPPAALPESQSPENRQNAAPLPSNLLPRCDDQIFKARGDCVDPSAGAAPLPPDAPVPRELVPFAKSAARDIILTDDGDGVSVKPAPSAKLPLIYTFRLAHLQ
ncbi:DUF4384 domain-containing protein [Acidicapsa acidisoli]|uniref:DUF4384 domain-containing protein n=1 Tax=Acidicapsa acidisoli TaxID=1615681 RepID=UPI0021DF7CED|nr:DUF4384 domain-containing protein [Acidicapsa acidisoli]